MLRSAFVLLGLTTAYLCEAVSSDLFPYEQITLSPNDERVRAHPKLLDVGSGRRQCRLLPGDKDWPPESTWKVVSSLVEGNLLSPPPLASSCYVGERYNATNCAEVVKQWGNPDFHIDHPTSLMNPIETGLACLPTEDPNSGNCTQGSYPVKVINAKTVRDIQVGVLVASTQNLRLVIKNTGHDFLGKSGGTGGLSIRTHGLKDMKLIRNYVSPSYIGPVYKVGAGVQVHDVYETANRDGFMLVGGSCRSVGYAGGYFQGGGQSPLSASYGLGADSVLAINLVTSSGAFITASATQNSDLYWAMRGGGGSTFGVVTSIIVRPYKTIPSTVVKFSFGPSAADKERAKNGDHSLNDFWGVVKKYLSILPEHAKNRVYSVFWINPESDTEDAVFTMDPIVGWNKNPKQVASLIKPILDEAASHNITITPNITSYSTFFDAWSTFAEMEMGHWNQQLVSRMFPRESFVEGKRLEKTFNAIRGSINNGTMLVGFGMTPTLHPGNIPGSAHPAWRSTILYAYAVANWDPELRDLAVIDTIRKDFVGPKMQPWRDASPGSGSYLNEGNMNEPNLTDAFWGPNYPRLLKIKQKWDPNGIFFSETSVGSEKWTTGLNHGGRLCPV